LDFRSLLDKIAHFDHLGIETKYFWLASGVDDTFAVYHYQNGTENASLCMQYNFGRTAQVADAVYFPLSENCPGIVVAVSDRSMEKHGDYLAYFSLKTRRLLKCVYVNYPITKICPILDGTAQKSDYQQLNPSFHTDWPHILLVGTRFGGASLLHLDLTEADDLLHEHAPNGSQPQQDLHKTPVKTKRVVQLSSIFV
jgi:hypothetical protein